MKNEMFNELLESVKEMDQIAKGKKKPARKFVFKEPEVKDIREQTGLSQVQFARLIGVSKRTLENWEQGRRQLARVVAGLQQTVAALAAK